MQGIFSVEFVNSEIQHLELHNSMLLQRELESYLPGCTRSLTSSTVKSPQKGGKHELPSYKTKPGRSRVENSLVLRILKEC